MLKALSKTSTELQLNSRWVMDFAVTDDDGYLVTGTLTLTADITLPDGSTVNTPAVLVETGTYRVAYKVVDFGRHIASVVSSNYGAVSFATFVQGPTNAPTIDELKAYLGTEGWSVDDEQLQDALDTEAAAQLKACDVDAVYPVDLRQALLRRVARNLSLRNKPLAVLEGDAETGSLTLPGRDPEVRRLEAPYRKVVLL